MRFLYFFPILFLFFFETKAVKTPLNIFEDSSKFVYGDYSVYNDFTLNRDVYDIVKIPDSSFKLLPPLEKLTSPSCSHWLKFKIYNKTQNALIIRGIKYYDFFNLYYLKDGKPVSIAEMKINDNIFNRSFPFIDYLVEIPNSKDTVTFLLNLKVGKHSSGMGYLVYRNNEIYKNSMLYFIFQAFYIGTLLLVIVFTSVLWIKNKEILYGLYAAFLVTQILSALSRWGYIFTLFDIQYWDKQLDDTINRLVIIFFVFYARHFLKLWEKTKMMDRFLLCSLASRILVYCMSLITKEDYFLYHYWDHLIYIPLIVSTVYLILKFYNSYLWFFFIPLSLMYATFNIDFHFSLSDSEIFRDAHIIYFLSVIIEVTCFTLALVYQISLLKRDIINEHLKTIESQNLLIEATNQNIILKNEYSENLEREVKEKTFELQSANQNLLKLTEEISYINKLLKADNIKLEHDLEILNTARLLEKNISFDEFKKMLPDENAALKFVAEYKWRKGYKCLKCGYKNKYYIGQTAFSRKCPVCKYTETATHNSTLNNIKFSPLKALYILYRLFDSKNVNLSKLADELELRKGTCYEFVNKIKAYEGYETINKANKNDWIDYLNLKGENSIKAN